MIEHDRPRLAIKDIGYEQDKLFTGNTCEIHQPAARASPLISAQGVTGEQGG